MQKSIKKISFLIILILLLPISVFFIYQFASLNKSEQEISQIYNQQLETIIFSINQYSEDIINSWANEIEGLIKSEQEQEWEKFFTENSSVKNIFVVDNNLEEFQTFSDLSELLIDSAKIAIKNKNELSSKLFEYLKIGYQKIEPIGKISKNNLYLCLFVFEDDILTQKYCGIIFQANEFVKRNLVSKIAQASGDQFTLATINESDNSIVTSSSKVKQEELTLRKSLWVVPDFSLGIKLKSGNIEELISKRLYENIIILVSLVIILLVGIWLIYLNIRKELRLTQLKSDFISNVSHELRTPLSLISMYSETLVLDRLKNEEKKREYYTVINNETNRLSKIVNSILNFSKMESGTRKYIFENVDLVELSNDVLNTYDFHIKSKGFTYSVNIHIPQAYIVADADAITESMINLIENSIKYCDNKKEFKIDIGVNKKGSFWKLQDFGVGIKEEDQSKIFDKFYRVSSGLVHNTKGTGLGLSLVKQIMQAHEADVTVSSSHGKGSTFSLQFNKNFKNN